jgi:thiol-disulfide isomerase/thioredoxin
MKQLVLSIAIAALIPLGARADLIHLTTGQEIKGTVMSYANVTFEVETESGTVTRYAAASIKKIEFTRPEFPAVLETRHGVKEGSVTLFENSAFTIKTHKGVEKLPAIQVTSATLAAAAGPDVKLITRSSRVDVSKNIVRGKITVVTYYAEWCVYCQRLMPHLEKMAKEDADVVLRKVDIGQWKSPVAQQYNIASVPRTEVYDRAGKLAGTIAGSNHTGVAQTVKKAKSE